MLKALMLIVMLISTGCAATAPAIIAAVASGATAAHDLLQLPGDVLAAVSASCQLLKAAQSKNPALAAKSAAWYSPICANVQSNNDLIDNTTAGWVAQEAGRLEVQSK